MWQRRLECYRYMLGKRNIAANDIVCPVLGLERLRSETNTDTFIANDNLMNVWKGYRWHKEENIFHIN